MSKKIFSLVALLFVALFTFSGAAFSGDGSNYRQLQQIDVFFNNSGAALSAGDVVILDTAGTGVTAGTTLGAYVTTVASADSVLVVGVVPEAITSCADQTPCPVVTKGPVDTYVLDGADAVTINTAVGTTAMLKHAGGGTNLGIALEAGGATNGEKVIVWVDPTGAD